MATLLRRGGRHDCYLRSSSIGNVMTGGRQLKRERYQFAEQAWCCPSPSTHAAKQAGNGTAQVNVAAKSCAQFGAPAARAVANVRSKAPRQLCDAECKQLNHHELPMRAPIWEQCRRCGCSEGVGFGRGRLKVAWADRPRSLSGWLCVCSWPKPCRKRRGWMARLYGPLHALKKKKNGATDPPLCHRHYDVHDSISPTFSREWRCFVNLVCH